LPGHIEQINLWHRSGDVEQGIDSPKTIEGPLDEGFNRMGLPQVERVCLWVGARGFYFSRRRLQLILVSRGKNDSGEVTCQSQCSRTADPLACASDYSNGTDFHAFPITGIVL